MVVTRFAPSPTGDLHLGHAYAALFASDKARRSGGRFLVRIEDIDAGRCREMFVERNLEDLRWLGLTWDEPVLRQSARLPLYAAALERLRMLDVVYPCFFSRKAIQAEIRAAGGAPHDQGTGTAYPGTCRKLEATQSAELIEESKSWALRLNSAKALRLAGELDWIDRRYGRHLVSAHAVADVVIARKEFPASYHLAVVVDDAAQEVSLVTRGEDLLAATHVHRLLQALLDLPVPEWWHHPLCRDAGGRRLAKRAGDASIRALRDKGLKAAEVLHMARPDRTGGASAASVATRPVR
jgi:glutamyl-Q tRNA(Asp) synthetase